MHADPSNMLSGIMDISAVRVPMLDEFNDQLDRSRSSSHELGRRQRPMMLH